MSDKETSMGRECGDQQRDDGACKPGCCCRPAGISARMKWLICGAVALAAVATVAVRASRSTPGATGRPGDSFPATMPSPAGEPGGPGQDADPDGWEPPLAMLSDLDQAASNFAAVFVMVPCSDSNRNAAARNEVSNAARLIRKRGIRIGSFMLSPDSPQYGEVAQKVGSPAVLAMYKGIGTVSVAGDDVTVDKLLKAFVAAQRPPSCSPSGCGPSACGPSGCN